MRVFPLLLMLFLCFSCATTKNSLSNKLNGTWIPENQEIGGFPMSKLIYASQRLIIKDSTYTVMAESIDKGIIRFKDDKMDIYGKEGINKGRHFTALYKLENGKLTICYNLEGTQYPEAFTTNGKPLYFLSVFHKEMSK